MTVMFTLQLMAALPSAVAEPFIEFGCVDAGVPQGQSPVSALSPQSLTEPDRYLYATSELS
jgi:hypothetical protein